MINQKHHFELFATYNADMNTKLCQLLADLPVEEHVKNRQAFFGSILGTLNHILVGDLIWLNRFRRFERDFVSLNQLDTFPLPTKLDQILYQSATEFSAARTMLDDIIRSFIEETKLSDYEKTLSYKNTKGMSHTKSFGLLLTHLFNHQTHHRGQVSTLFHQLGVDVGVTDFLVWIDC